MQITIRGIDPELAKIITRLAREEGISLNKAALKILARGAGQSRKAKVKNVIVSDLDHLFGTWKKSDADAFLKSIRSCGQIDQGFWK